MATPSESTTAQDPGAAATFAPPNPDNIQGDIILGLHKKKEAFFFQIVDPDAFRIGLVTIIPQIATTTQVRAASEGIAKNKKTPRLLGGKKKLLRIQHINVAFTQHGLDVLGIHDDLGDPLFKAGQRADAQALGDVGTIDAQNLFHPPEWQPAFKSKLDGVFLITGESVETIREGIDLLEKTFRVHKSDPITVEVLTLRGSLRPDAAAGHEHFGFQDGVSQPLVQGFGTALLSQQTILPGWVLVGEKGDKVTTRPAWAKDGSFLAFRKLKQYVPEFNAAMKANVLSVQGADNEELLAARLVGRWKDGTPIDIAPLKADPTIAADQNKINNFDFSGDVGQMRCPYVAHIRRMNPRSGLPAGCPQPWIIRQGIPFGPEVSAKEEFHGKTIHDRGLLFVCYQSNLNAFHFLQQKWANETGFPARKPVPRRLDLDLIP